MQIPLKILVTDDDITERALIRRFAEGLGWSVDEAASVREMSTWLRARPAGELTCVLVAYPLPDGDAFDALAAAKALRPDFPVVILSEDNDADVVLRLINNGASARIEKSGLSEPRLAESRLGQTIRRAMRGKGAGGIGEQTLLVTAFQQLPAALLVVDRFGNVILHNAKWLELLGQTLGSLDTVQEMLERARSTILEASSDRADLLQAIVEGRTEPADFALSLDDHQTVTVCLRQMPMVDGQRVIGSMVLLEDAREDTNIRQQPRILQKACHDLRNPLSAIMISANILSRDTALLNERRIKLAARILSSATRMNRMLGDLFDYALAAQGKALTLQRRDADFSVIASEAVAEVRSENPGRTLVFETHGDLRGMWDAKRISQMLTNLIAIAMKRGSATAHVIVECQEQTQPHPPTIELRLSIKHDDASTQFGMTGQPAPPAEGASIEPGLYIARRIAEAHQGTVEVSARETEAPLFLVKLPKTPIEVGNH